MVREQRGAGRLPGIRYSVSALGSAIDRREPFSEANVAMDRDSILSYYYNNGYPDAVFDWTQSPGPAEYRVDMAYVVRPGNANMCGACWCTAWIRRAPRWSIADSSEPGRSHVAEHDGGEPAKAVRPGHLFQSADGDSESRWR